MLRGGCESHNVLAILRADLFWFGEPFLYSFLR
jgi:hypothetical protein